MHKIFCRFRGMEKAYKSFSCITSAFYLLSCSVNSVFQFAFKLIQSLNSVFPTILLKHTYIGGRFQGITIQFWMQIGIFCAVEFWRMREVMLITASHLPDDSPSSCTNVNPDPAVLTLIYGAKSALIRATFCAEDRIWPHLATQVSSPTSLTHFIFWRFRFWSEQKNQYVRVLHNILDSNVKELKIILSTELY